MHRGINRVILAKKRPTAVQSLYMPIYKDVGHLWNVRAKMMDEGRSSRNSHYSTGNLLRAKLLDFKRSFRAIYTFFGLDIHACILVTAWVELAIQIGDRFFSLYSWYTQKKKTNSKRALVFSVMSSFPLYLNSKKEKKRFNAEDFVWKGRWSGHASSPTDSARKCRGWNAWSMSTEMKAVLVGQPSFAFLNVFLFHFLPPFPLVRKEGM